MSFYRMDNKYQYAIVVGASSGIGSEIAKQLAAGGCKVAAVARRKDRLDAIAASMPNVIPFGHDVTHYDDVPALFQEITKQLGGLDLIVYAAGVMPDVAAEEYDFAKDRAMIDTNLLGAMAWLNQAAVRFGSIGAGTILGIGSVAGDRGRSGKPAYNSSKAALATYLEALRNRLSRKGVKVVTVKPGPVYTDMSKSHNLKKALTADRAAELILKKSRRAGEHYLQFTHRVIFAMIRLTPSFIFRRINLP